MAHLLLPGEVRRAFEAAIAESTEVNWCGGFQGVDTDHAWDQFMDNLEAEGFTVVKKAQADAAAS